MVKQPGRCILFVAAYAKNTGEKLHTSQPRVAMMEKGDPSVSLDLLIRALLVLGIPKKTDRSGMIRQV